MRICASKYCRIDEVWPSRPFRAGRLKQSRPRSLLHLLRATKLTPNSDRKEPFDDTAGPDQHVVPVSHQTVAAGRLVMVVLHIVVTFGIQLGTGIPYKEWISTPENGLRAAVIPLVAGSLLLIVFLAIARWDMIWRDPGRLPTTTVMKVAMIFFIACIVLRAFGIDWGTVDPALLFVVIASGVLVGFAEEMLFRGIFLRSLRTNGRTEAVAALWTAIAFGLFHLPNLIVGVGGAQSSRSSLRRPVAPPCTRSGATGASS